MSYKRRIYCKYCEYFCFSDGDMVSHIEKHHQEYIPDNMSPWHYFFYLKTGKKEGSCVVCKRPTTFNEKSHKYNRFCENPNCKIKYREMFKNRMIGKYGKVTLLDDPDQQRKMLANRRISGKYLWMDKVHSFSYTGQYEKSFLQFLDEVLMWDCNDIIMPSPHTYYYEYEGEKHFYIPDVFIPSLELEIEIKDGGDNPNLHPKIQAVDKVKEKLKDEVMKDNNFNYLKITDMNNMKFIEYLNTANVYANENIKKKIYMI